MFAAVGAIIVLFILWKLFVDGWLFKIILFGFGWFGIFVAMRVLVAGAKDTVMTLGANMHVSWSVLVPTIICLLCLLCTKSES